jgi:alpha-beta hydrolase superfamily lysophospholipase
VGDLVAPAPAHRIVATDGVELECDLAFPAGASGVVVFAHGSGSSRHSPRNRRVAALLNQRGLATVLVDLLSSREEAQDRLTGQLRFDVQLLARRLEGVVDAVERDAPGLPFGLFGASTGAAAALIAASARARIVGAVVSRGGRPDLAGRALARVHAPTLLIVGGRDREVLGLNQQALELLAADRKELVVVPGATHLFEEPGALDQVAELAAGWFSLHLGGMRDRGATRASLRQA